MTETLIDAAQRGQKYLEDIGSRPVFPRPENVRRLESALATDMPEGPTPADDVLAFMDDYGSPATVASTGGRYFGFVTGGALPASAAAHTLATAWDQNCFSYTSSPAAALFEQAALRWLKDIFGFPADSEGTLVTGATMANFTGLAAARHEVLAQGGLGRRQAGAARVAARPGHRRPGSARHALQDDLPARVRPRARRARAGRRPGTHECFGAACDPGSVHRLHPGGQREFRRLRSRAGDHRARACRRRMGARGRRLRVVGALLTEARASDGRIRGR